MGYFSLGFVCGVAICVLGEYLDRRNQSAEHKVTMSQIEDFKRIRHESNGTQIIDSTTKRHL